MDEVDYAGIGRFIFGAHRCGGDMTDIARWMADDLGFAIPDAGDESAVRGMYTAFFEKHKGEELAENYAQFLAVLESRKQQP